MKILALDTSSRYGSIALCQDGQVLAEYTTLGIVNQTERLLPTLERLLQDVSWTPQDLDGFAVVHGPGSFTGVRVGLATVQGLALATGKPAVGISSLEALALGLSFVSVPICPVQDARKAEIYTTLLQWQAGRLEALLPEQVTAPEVFLDRLEGPVLFVGDGLEVIQPQITGFPRIQPLWAPGTSGLPRAGAIGLWAAEPLRSAAPDSAASLRPIYLRASEAELKLKAAHAGASST